MSEINGKRRRLEVESTDHVDWCMCIVHFRDPDGSLIESNQPTLMKINVSAIWYKLASGFSYSQTESTPAHTQVKQTVCQVCLQRNSV